MIKSKIIIGLILLILVAGVQAQSQLLDSVTLSKQPLFTNLSMAMKSPDKVYRLDLHKIKLKRNPKRNFYSY